MTGESTISVALCTYNGERFLQQQLDSIAAQSLPPSELVVLDDCSSDSTLKIIEAFSKNAPFQVSVTRNSKNLGSTKNFEKAIGLCSGAFIALSDQDDIWHPEKLARLHHALVVNGRVDGAFSDADLIDDDSSILENKRLLTTRFRTSATDDAYAEAQMFQTLLKQYFVTGATLMFRSRSRGMLTPIPTSWVHDAWIAWILVATSGLVLVEEPLISYRLHQGQQIGMGPRTFSDKWSRIRNTEPSHFLATLKRYELLRDHCLRVVPRMPSNVIRDWNAKIEFLRYQYNLTTGGGLRLLKILKRWSGYQTYARGVNSIVEDLLRQ